MTALVIVLVLLAALGVAAVLATRRRQALQQSEEQEALRKVTRVADEDVTRFGEELQDLHIETLTTEIDPGMRQDYQRALDSYESAKELLAEARQPDDVKEVTRALEDGRYAMACVLARQEGVPLPQRRAPCFFNAAHGPSVQDVEWAPPGGVSREVPVCAADADRVAQGAEPDTRMVKDGNRMVPWYDGGPAYRPYADGYYGLAVMNGLFPAFFLGAMMSGGMAFGDTSGGDPSGGGDGGAGGGDGGDFGGDGGGDFGGGDFGGGDFGGGDFGGF
ncbi:hypothetical protein RDV89_00460 [Nocardioides zeae]|uniref:DUF1542 domain-containing protein n=1 Tax=Nocardioides imazamoxiresistens TaxID=3231893 RepID=A0ABU3PQM4_9ACTN|nr:hypothetical protein [Nocardioides zeae]MDT9591517.1 hypothetical protein [Nocardioides zeae]